MGVIVVLVLVARKSTCPQKRDHFKRKFNLPTIDFQEIYRIPFIYMGQPRIWGLS